MNIRFLRSLKCLLTAAVCILCFSGNGEYLFALDDSDTEHDVNGDGIIDIDDAELLNDFLLGKNVKINGNADINNDGNVNIFDLIQLKRILQSEGFTSFISADGRILRDENGQQFIIKGMAFGNKVWDNPTTPPVNKHHTEKSYEELAQLGFNSVRFYINYGLFEDDSAPYEYKESGFEWLDQNIDWAEKYGIRLILNMHYPQGGYQSQGNGDALWTVEENQERLEALWTEIARRYSNEPTILGYGIVNEPVVSIKTTEGDCLLQWQELAQEITDSIKTVDENHLIFIEKMCAAKDTVTGNSKWNNFNDDNNFVKIDGENIVYEFHYYDYHPFTHQGFDWAGTQSYDVTYPDESLVVSASGSTWETATFNGEIADNDSEEWQYLESSLITITKDNYKIVKPVFQAQGLGKNGYAYADNLQIDEYDENGDFVNTVYFDDFNSNSSFSFWALNGVGSSYKSISGYDDSTSLCIRATTSDASVSGKDIIAVKGHSYKASGYFKVENAEASAIVRPRVDVLSSDFVSTFNKNYLEQSILNNIQFSIENNVPIYCGEFGAGINCFKNDRGGEKWVSDVIDIFIENDISFNYHTYHETSFGLYTDWSLLPTTLNEVLYELFAVKLTGSRSP